MEVLKTYLRISRPDLLKQYIASNGITHFELSFNYMGSGVWHFWEMKGERSGWYHEIDSREQGVELCEQLKAATGLEFQIFE
jgi:hypothetical protein